MLGSHRLLNVHILVKLHQLLIFVGNSHTLQILMISYSLEIATYQQEVDFVLFPFLQLPNVIVNGVELSMTTTLDCDLNHRSDLYQTPDNSYLPSFCFRNLSLGWRVNLPPVCLRLVDLGLNSDDARINHVLVTLHDK